MKKTAVFLLLLLTLSLFATNEIRFVYDSVGDPNLYVIIGRTTDAKVWDSNNTAWADWVDANEPNYALVMSKARKDFYDATFPTDISTAGTYPLTVYLQASTNPNITDDLIVGEGQLFWGGSAEITEADKALAGYDPPTKAELDTAEGTITSAISGLNNLSASEVNSCIVNQDVLTQAQADANFASTNGLIEDVNTNIVNTIADQNDITVDEIFAKTGITAGGTWTFAKILKIATAWQVGTWQDKSGESGTREVLDGEDDSTVVAEVTMGATSPQKEVTIP